jgi:penicillin-binding protein 1A
MTLGTVGVSSAAQTYFSKEPKNLAIEESTILVGMFKIQVYTIRTKSCRVKTGEMWYLLRWRKEILLRKKKRETQSLPITLDFKLESHRRISNLFQSTFVIT